MPLPDHLLEHVAERFRVLGDVSRLRIIQALLSNEELTVGQLVAALGMSQANVSKHVRVLQEAGLVRRRPRGTSAYLSLVDASAGDLCDLVCDQLRAQKAAEAAVFAR